MAGINHLHPIYTSPAPRLAALVLAPAAHQRHEAVDAQLKGQAAQRQRRLGAAAPGPKRPRVGWNKWLLCLTHTYLYIYTHVYI